MDALRNGAIDYLLKPLKPQDIIERAQSILASQKKEKRKREIVLQIEALQAELKSLSSGQTGPLQAASLGTDRFLKRGKLVLDLHKRRLIIHEQAINIPPTSFDYLLGAGTPFTRSGRPTRPSLPRRRVTRPMCAKHRNSPNGIFTNCGRQSGRTEPILINVRGTGYRLVAD